MVGLTFVFLFGDGVFFEGPGGESVGWRSLLLLTEVASDCRSFRKG